MKKLTDISTKAPEQPPEVYPVWINEQSHIASFHQVEGYQRRLFHDHDFFVHYLYALQRHGYRFQ